MGLRLELMEFQIALLELKAANMRPDSIFIPGYVRRGLSATGPEAHVALERKRRLRDKKQLLRCIRDLKRRHYVQTVKEGQQQLLKLTKKGEYEILRLQFMIHMQNLRKAKWDGKLWLAMYDIPESKRIYRIFFGRLLKQAGFRIFQRSIWISRYNPNPALKDLLKYLGLEEYFEVLDVYGKACSARFLRKVGL